MMEVILFIVSALLLVSVAGLITLAVININLEADNEELKDELEQTEKDLVHVLKTRRIPPNWIKGGNENDS